MSDKPSEPINCGVPSHDKDCSCQDRGGPTPAYSTPNPVEELRALVEMFRRQENDARSSSRMASHTYYTRFRDGQALAFGHCAQMAEAALERLEKK